MSSENTANRGFSAHRSIAFVDRYVSQADELLQGLHTDEVFFLDDQSSGIDQITQILEKYTNLEGVHIFSHGSQGELQLGNAILSESTLEEYQDQLESWQTAFSQEGDLLLYGCDFAGNDAGAKLVDQLSQLTQTDVAASIDVTGHEKLGGDWDLEYETGDISRVIAIESYQGILPIYNGNTYVLTDGVKTWEEAQAEAESLGGNLVTINDAAEESWLKETFGEGERLWIGINDVAAEGQFMWASGEAVTYTNWAPGEPNDFDGVQDFGLMNFSTTRQWDDERPTRTFQGVIEIAGDAPEPPEPPTSPSLTVSFGDFSDTSAFSLNGSAAGAADRLRLTPDTRTQAGSAFLNEVLAVDSTTRFSSQFQFQLNGGQGTAGADGFAFVLQNSGAGAGALGGSGGNVGYSGIDASIAIEFDTYQGSGDPNDNHISLLQNGEIIGGLLNADTDLDLNGGDTLTAWVDYDGATNELSVYLSDTGVKPLDALLSYNLDLEAILGGQAYVGFAE